MELAPLIKKRTKIREKLKAKQELKAKSKPEVKPKMKSEPEPNEKSGFDLHQMSYAQVAVCFGTSSQAIREWVKAGCPKNEHTIGLDLPAVISWKMARIQAKNELGESNVEELKREKLRHEIEKLKAGNEILRSETIPREEHNRIFVQMGQYIKDTLQNCITANAPQFIGLQSFAEAHGQLTLLVQVIFKKMKNLIPKEEKQNGI